MATIALFYSFILLASLYLICNAIVWILVLIQMYKNKRDCK